MHKWRFVLVYLQPDKGFIRYEKLVFNKIAQIEHFFTYLNNPGPIYHVPGI